MSLSPIVIWLAEVVGKRTVNQLLARADPRELTTIRRALTDAQDKVDELQGIERLFDSVSHQRDNMQATIIRLEIDNADLRRRIAELTAGRT